MANQERNARRANRALVLAALHDETGSFGGDAAADRVQDFMNQPQAASTTEFAYVGALTLTRFYVAPDKPNGAERKSLWQALRDRFDKPDMKDPGGWSGETNVSQLQAIVEEA